MPVLTDVLKLDRPLAALDLETTGKSAALDRIVQMSITMFYPSKPPVTWNSLVNPGIPIPKEATDTHHITDEMVKDAPRFGRFASSLAPHLTGVDFTGYNLKSYDLPLLREEMKRVNVAWDWEENGTHVVDSLRIYHILEPRTLAAAYKRFTGKTLEGAHDAGADVAATVETLIGQLVEFPDIPRTVPELADYCFPQDPNRVDRSGKIVWREGQACLGFGKKWNGTPLRSIDKGYLRWMLANDFPADTKAIIQGALDGVFPEQRMLDVV